MDDKEIESAEKEWPCDACGTMTTAPIDYEQEGCCSGRECGCMGRHINPIFCDECTKKIFGER